MLCLSKLAAIVDESVSCKTAVAGNFNATSNSLFQNKLLKWCWKNKVIISDHKVLGINHGTNTKVSDAHCTNIMVTLLGVRW